MVLRRMLLICSGWRCGGSWRAKLSRFCTICLVRCASSRITCRSLRALLGHVRVLHQQIGESHDGRERIVDLMRHAGNKLADGGHFFRVHQLGLDHGRVGDIGHQDHDAGDVAAARRAWGSGSRRTCPAVPLPRMIISSRLSDCRPCRVASKASANACLCGSETMRSRRWPTSSVCSKPPPS